MNDLLNKIKNGEPITSNSSKKEIDSLQSSNVVKGYFKLLKFLLGE